MAFDRFETRVDPTRYLHWPGGGGFQPVELLVNGVGLIDVVRDVELPHALREYDERLAAGETAEGLGSRGSLAGNYLYPSSREVFLPLRNLLGQAYEHGIIADWDDLRNRKSLLLGCTCGVTDCWFLLATKTQVDDAGIEHLAALTMMRLLVLDDTNATDAGIRRLRTLLPNCEISFPP